MNTKLQYGVLYWQFLFRLMDVELLSASARGDAGVRIPAKANAIPTGSRTAFRAEAEHYRSVATLAFRLCKKCSTSSRETIRSEAEAGCR